MQSGLTATVKVAHLQVCLGRMLLVRGYLDSSRAS